MGTLELLLFAGRLPCWAAWRLVPRKLCAPVCGMALSRSRQSTHHPAPMPARATHPATRTHTPTTPRHTTTHHVPRKHHQVGELRLQHSVLDLQATASAVHDAGWAYSQPQAAAARPRKAGALRRRPAFDAAARLPPAQPSCAPGRSWHPAPRPLHSVGPVQGGAAQPAAGLCGQAGSAWGFCMGRAVHARRLTVSWTIVKVPSRLARSWGGPARDCWAPASSSSARRDVIRAVGILLQCYRTIFDLRNEAGVEERPALSTCRSNLSTARWCRAPGRWNVQGAFPWRFQIPKCNLHREIPVKGEDFGRSSITAY